MIESYENGLQIAVLLVCLFISIGQASATRDKAWTMLSFFYGAWILGDLYWEIFLIIFHETPRLYVSDFSWHAAYIFLFLLLKQTMPPKAARGKHVLPWLGVVFSAAMCVFYLQWGDVASNLICALLMGLLFFYSIQGLLYLREAPDRRQKLLYVAVLVFCIMEYITWTASCFWAGDSFSSPYIIADMLLTASLVPFISAVRKAVRT